MTIDDILEEKAEMRENIKCREDIIAHNMTQMAEMIQRNIESIDINKYNIDQNKADTDNNITNLTKDINDNKNTIEQTNGSHQTWIFLMAGFAATVPSFPAVLSGLDNILQISTVGADSYEVGRTRTL